ncbi:MAG: DNA polymerase III subunit epsilon [Rickettsiales bacterium]|nr:DNA polymerase III subunit epsilon [Rickettsiales bacterium]
MREICLDIETTGLNPNEGHKIVEIACVEIINKVRSGKVFHTYVNPRRDMPAEAFAIHGISTEFLQDKPIFDHIVHKFLDFTKDATLVIHNAAFDTKFLNHELSILGLEPIKKENVVDSLIIARNKFPGAQNSLDALCKRFGIDLSKREKHGALLDTELLVDVYVELMGGMQRGLSFDDFKNEKKSASIIEKNNEIKKVRKTLEKREFPVPDEILQKHQEFILKNFKSNFWGY